MSIIQTIRDKGTWVIFILLGLALISFIFMDAGQRGDLFGGNKSNPTVGVINGSKIKNNEFSIRSNALMYAYEKNPQITKDQIEQYVWNSLVDEKLMDNELSKLDISLDDKSLADLAIGKYGQPNQHMTQLFKGAFGDQVVDPQSGQLNPVVAEQALKQMQSQKNGNEDAQKFLNAFNGLLPLAKFEYLRDKHSMLMGTTNFVPNWLANKRVNDNNTLVNMSYVYLPYAELTDSTIKELQVTDADINTFIGKNPGRYKQQDARSLDYITFDFKPTSADTNEVKNLLAEKRAKLELTPDSAAGIFVMNNNSLLPYNDVYVRKSEVKVGDSNAVLTDGAMFGPYLTGNNLAIAKVIESKNYADTANVRHILIATFDSQTKQVIRDDASAKKLMDSVIGLYRAGQSFDSLAKKFSDDPGSKDSGGLYKNVSFGQQFVQPFIDFAFTHNAGDTGTIKTFFGYHFMRAEGTRGSAKPAFKVAYLSKAIAPTQRTKDSVEGIATAFAANVRTGKEFDDYFIKNPTAVKQNGYNIDRNNLRLPGIEDNVKDICKWAFKAKPNDVSSHFSLDKANKFVIAKLTNIQNEGLPTAADIRKLNPTVLEQIKAEKKYAYMAKKYGTPATIEEAAAKTGKQVLVSDSISYASGVIPGLSPEGRVVGAAFNPVYETKVSGPIKGTTGMFYVKANGKAYLKQGAVVDEKQVQKTMEQELGQLSQQSAQIFRKDAKIKDKRLEVGY